MKRRKRKRSEPRKGNMSHLMSTLRKSRKTPLSPVIRPGTFVDLQTYSHFLGIIVPSKDKSGKLLPKSRERFALKLSEEFFAGMEGAWTSLQKEKEKNLVPTRGTYLSKNNLREIRENGTLVFAFTKRMNAKKLSAMIAFAMSIRIILDQETLALFVDGSIILVGKHAFTY